MTSCILLLLKRLPLIILLPAACSISFIAMNLSPPNGSLTARLIGATDSASFQCDIFAENNGEISQIGTTWSVQAFGSEEEILVHQSGAAQSTFEGVLQIGGTARPTDSPLAGLTFMNRLMVLNFTEDLDRMVLNCLDPNNHKMGYFILRVYSKLVQCCNPSLTFIVHKYCRGASVNK